jgi:hypothetical protein
MNDFADIVAPVLAKQMQSASHTQSGPAVEPINRVLLYSSGEWESFIDEWVSSCLKKKYVAVRRYTGSKDKGIDIAGFVDAKQLEGIWDNYQCKHYDHPLHPTDAWPEIAKILWHSFSGHYAPPRAYYFIAPRNVGTTLGQLLANKTALKAQLIDNWDKHCRDAVTSMQSIPLEDKFAEYVEKFDFGIFDTKTIREIIDEHRASPYFIQRFGGGLPPRPKPEAPPGQVLAEESRYVANLLDAYADHTKQSIPDVTALKQWNKLDDHFHRQREAFYHAESLRVFVRDKVEPGTFESLQDEIFAGVIDTRDADHVDGYQCVVAVTDAALQLQIDSHPLAPSTFIRDRQGICHQLSNEDRLKWTK